MYIAFGNRVVDSMDMKKLIEDNTEFKVIMYNLFEIIGGVLYGSRRQ